MFCLMRENAGMTGGILEAILKWLKFMGNQEVLCEKVLALLYYLLLI